MTLSEIVVWFAEQRKAEHSSGWLEKNHIKKYQLEQLLDMGIVSYLPSRNTWFLLGWSRYQPGRRAA